jgi:hypothetical protein
MEFNNQEITNLWISPQIISNCFSFPDFVTFLTLVLFGDFMEKRDKSENKDGKKKKKSTKFPKNVTAFSKQKNLPPHLLLKPALLDSIIPSTPDK